MSVLLGLVGASLVAWIGLIIGRGFFWRPWPILKPAEPTASSRGCSVAAVIPARNEAEILPQALPTVLSQDYSGPFRVVLVDDRSEDDTRKTAQSIAGRSDAEEGLVVVQGKPLPGGWSGKVWAMQQGVAAVVADSTDARSPRGVPDYFWFTDADIAHAPWVLRALIERAEAERLDLVSTMATLRVETAWDRLLIPAFVYFFAKLYPFRFVADPKRRAAGAAGGCILVRRQMLDAAGGLSAIGSALIDDCALGRLVKDAGGRLWLGFSQGVRSLRGYGSLSSVWQMVTRSAYTQLGHSSLKLGATVLGMLFLYALAPAACIGGAVATVFGLPEAAPVAVLGGVTWGLMAGSFVPMLRYLAAGWWVAPLLPVAGVLYVAMTISSAWQHAKGKGGSWKGRTYSGSDDA